MNKDLSLFTDAVNHLVFLTTRDEYGTVRSRGVQTYLHLVEELNDQGIVPDRGYWTEDSLKSFFQRIEKRYPEHYHYEDCDLEFVGRSAWEYQSRTKHEQVCAGRNAKVNSHHQSDKAEIKSQIAYTALHADINNWKSYEIDEVHHADKIIMKKYENSSALDTNF